MKNVYIVAAKRTPQGRFLGALAGMSAVELAIAAGREALKKVQASQVDQVIVGNVVSAGQGMNLARQVGVGLGIPIECPAFTVNMMCASGMHAVRLAAQSVATGEARVVLCGGTESMSNAPYLLERARTGYRLGDGNVVDGLLRDGLVDPFSHEHMGLTVESLGKEYGVTRDEQDAFALLSHQRWFKAYEQGIFAGEVVELPQLACDEHPRSDTTLEKLGSLKPAFAADGTVTAGNASGINDGAAMLIVCSDDTAREEGWKPLAALRAWAAIGCDPARMGLGPVHATRKLCQIHNLALEDFDAIEINEAFAAQTLVCLRELGLKSEQINACGGAIAVGHPIGTSGARLIAHLAHRIARGESRQALATLCVGAGMGGAAALEAV